MATTEVRVEAEVEVQVAKGGDRTESAATAEVAALHPVAQRGGRRAPRLW